MTYELYHFGIKGMKWGVRRKAKKNAKRLKKDIKKFKRKREAAWVDAYNDATNVFNSNIDRLNAKYDSIDFTKPKNAKIQAKYQKEVGKMWTDAYKESAIKHIGKDPETKGYEYVNNLPMMNMYKDL